MRDGLDRLPIPDILSEKQMKLVPYGSDYALELIMTYGKCFLHKACKGWNNQRLLNTY